MSLSDRCALDVWKWQFLYIPSWAFLIICNISLKSSRHSRLSFVGNRVFLLAFHCSLRSQLMKWCTKGIIVPTCPSQPISISSSLAFDLPRCNKLLMSLFHAWYLSRGSEIISLLTSILHPRIVLTSLNPALAISFWQLSVDSRGEGSSWWLSEWSRG